MKNFIKHVSLFLIGLSVIQFIVSAATLTPGYSFGATEQVTTAKLATLVSAATITGIGAGDIANGAIGNVQLGANAVTTDKILDGTILTGDLLARTLVSANLATNAVTAIELNTNLSFRAGILDFTLATITANSVSNSAVLGVTTSAGAGNSGSIPKLNANGKLDTSFFSGSAIVSTNFPSHTGSGSANVFTQVGTITTTATNGTVSITGRALQVASGNALWLRVRDSTTNVIAQTSVAAAGIHILECSLRDTLSGATKTYAIDVASDGVSTTYTNNLTATVSNPIIQNGLGISILQTP